MSCYGDRVAALYDLFYQDKPYAEEARFVDSVLRKCGEGRCRRVLDVAGGTGSHSLELARLGYEVTCVDQSEGMLERARAKSRRQALEIRLVRQDMRALDLKIEPFDAAICLFDSIGYAMTDEAIEAAVKAIRAHVKEKGLFIVEYWHASQMMKSHEPLRIRRWRTDEGEVLRISETRLNADGRSATVTYSIYELGNDGRYRFTEEAHANRFFRADEIEDLLARNGFATLRSCSGYDWSQPVSDSTWHVVTVARNA